MQTEKILMSYITFMVQPLSVHYSNVDYHSKRVLKWTKIDLPYNVDLLCALTVNK